MSDSFPKIRKLIFSRGMCLGTCPVYKVSLFEDGRVEWLGERFVEVAGPATWSIPISQVVKIEKALHHASFQSLDASYIHGVTCQPSCDIQVEYQDGSAKSVHHYLGNLSAPKALEHLEHKLDKLLETASYVGDRSDREI